MLDKGLGDATTKLKTHFNIKRDLTGEEMCWLVSYHRHSQKKPDDWVWLPQMSSIIIPENRMGLIQVLAVADAIEYAAEHPPEKWYEPITISIPHTTITTTEKPP